MIRFLFMAVSSRDAFYKQHDSQPSRKHNQEKNQAIPDALPILGHPGRLLRFRSRGSNLIGDVFFRFLFDSMAPNQETMGVDPVRGTGDQGYIILLPVNFQSVNLVRFHNQDLVNLIR